MMAPSSIIAQLNREQFNISAYKPGVNQEKVARKILASDVYKIYVQGEIPIGAPPENEGVRNRQKEANRSKRQAS